MFPDRAMTDEHETLSPTTKKKKVDDPSYHIKSKNEIKSRRKASVMCQRNLLSKLHTFSDDSTKPFEFESDAYEPNTHKHRSSSSISAPVQLTFIV